MRFQNMKFWEATLSFTITVPGNGPDYLLGAHLLGVLACPPSSPSDQKWRQAERVLGKSVLLDQERLDPDWATRHQLIIPVHDRVPATNIDKKLQKIRTLHGHRLAAAQVAIPFFRQAERMAGGAPAATRRASTIDARIQKTFEQEANREEWLVKHGIARKPRFPKDDNFETRVLRPSYPVLHIAVAVAVAIDQSQKMLRAAPSEIQNSFPRDMGGPQISADHFLKNPDLARAVVRLAEDHERLIPHLPKLRIPHIVRLRLE
jgi:hypothetical protein